ncbi:hypothetical protein GCM10010917_22650 [Paenibacillus physcomitrellae]|uniref:Uncharacterized protein n=1 Tax=Paenibacillus physcomitrellae TaxID=1619311 RepID=A0ABQ1G4P1_9BACL|nr:hypothetical protein GCM10010917_22650 [Paenibacillus physcomitrellae]
MLSFTAAMDIMKQLKNETIEDSLQKIAHSSQTANKNQEKGYNIVYMTLEGKWGRACRKQPILHPNKKNSQL